MLEVKSMNSIERKELIKNSWELHNLIESNYLENSAVKGDPEWLEKQRILLADMAIHLLQTALDPKDIKLDKLKNNLHAILTISNQFLPKAHLLKAISKLYV